MNTKFFSILLVPALLALAACGSDNNNNAAAPATAPAVPGAPVLLLANLGVDVSLAAAVNGATNYEVHRHTADDSSAATRVGMQASIDENPFHDSDEIEAATTYYYWIRACNTTGCSDFGSSADVETEAIAQYSVVLTNLMANHPDNGNAPPTSGVACSLATPCGQVLSPPLAIAHDNGWAAFEAGNAASSGLEMLAEQGNPIALATEAEANSRNYQHHATGSLTPTAPGIIFPSATLAEPLVLRTFAPVTHLSVLTMLTRTNDGFAAIDSQLISDLEIDESRVFFANVWDAGTEANAESASTLLDATQQNGFNIARDDIADQVTLHPGVVTAHDGLTTSILTELERFDNPVLRVEVTRVTPTTPGS